MARQLMGPNRRKMDNSSEEYIFAVLTEWGFEVQKIPEAAHERPDFYAVSGDDEYLVEVKGKEPSRKQEQRRDELLLSGKVYDESYDLLRQSGLTKIVSKGKNQLKQYKSEADYFRVICLVGTGHNAEARLLQLEATLFGRTSVGDFSTESPLKHCYYFGFSDFYKYRDILDGAILIDANSEEGKLCINDHSPRYNKFRESSLARVFGTAVIDAPELDRKGEVFVVDSNIDRNDKNSVIDYVREKYSLGDLVMDMDMKMASAQVLTPGHPK